MPRRCLLAMLLLALSISAHAADVRFLLHAEAPPAGARVLDRRGDRWLLSAPEALVADLPGATVLPPLPTTRAARTWTPLTEPDPRIQTLADQVQWEQVAADLRWLLDLGIRYSFHENIHTVADSLEARLADLGLATEQHEFNLWGATVPNVIATQTGTVHPDSIFVICAHFDATSEAPDVATPGADDNGTGTVAVLTAARLLAGRPLDYTVQYVLFGGEEQGLRGSRAWVGDQAAAGVDIVGALNFDMLGWWEEGVPFDLEIETNAQSRWIAEAVVDCATNYAAMPYVLHEAEDIWWGDFYAFWEEGYAAVNHEESWDWGDPDFNPHYHSTSDLIEHLDPDFTTGNVRVAVTALATLAGLDTASATPEATPPAASLTAYPNPFNGRTTLVLAAAGGDRPVPVGLYDLTGRRVGTVTVPLSAGHGQAPWTALDAAGAPLPSGVYLARTLGPGPSAAGRVVYLK